MSKPELLILAVTVQGLSYGEAARRHGVSKALVHRLHHRWLVEGDAAFTPRSSRPKSNPNQTPPQVRELILQLRDTLTRDGFDAGADTIQFHLNNRGHHVSRSTIWRVLGRSKRILAQPQKRPKSSWLRFNAERPNQMWQSDFTHWRLPGGDEFEIIGWLDDHSRYLLHLTAHRRVTGKTVTDSFTQAATAHGYPASTLTDNGNVYTTRFAGGGGGRRTKNAFETLLLLEGIIQKNGRPYKPTTQGKIERFWQTLKKHLAQKHCTNLEELQAALDAFTDYYNHQRPHRALNRRTPHFAYTLIPKAFPTAPNDPELWRVRYDIIDAAGKVSLRFGNKLMHLGIGRAHARTPIIVLVHGLDATTITLDGTVLAEHRIDPEKSYQAKNENG